MSLQKEILVWFWEKRITKLKAADLKAAGNHSKVRKAGIPMFKKFTGIVNENLDGQELLRVLAHAHSSKHPQGHAGDFVDGNDDV